MKQILKIKLFLGCIISIVLMYGCSDTTQNPDPVVIISTDKTSIKANNKDKVFFTVTVDGNTITSPVVITQTSKNVSVEGMSFSTDSAATYTFFAIYDNIKSNEISIDAVDIEVIITADKQTIKANNKDMVVFTVKADGENVTSSATIVQVESPESMPADAGFYTKIPGIYTFYATYNGKKTKEITIDASAVMLSLSADKPAVKANNWEKAIFTVKADGEDVTSSAVIMKKITPTNFTALDNNEFLTDEAGTYTFYAIYEDVKSDEVNIEAIYVELAFLKSYSIIEFTSTACPICPLLTEELKTLQKSFLYPIHVIALHPSGKYCDSDLAGALGATAVNFVDNVPYVAIPPPLAIVDLYDPVHLYQRDTQTPLKKAIDRATLTRDRVSMTGMAVQSTTNGSKIDFRVSFKTIKTDNYHFFAFIVEDGVVNRQALEGHTMDPNFIFNNVATYKLAEGDPYSGVNIGTIVAGNETTRSFSINTDNFKTGRNVNLANCRIVCYTLRSKDGRTYFVDNVTSCPVTGSVRYLYER